ncbi:MAG: CdaR family protein [Planctomycetota bacterium]
MPQGRKRRFDFLMITLSFFFAILVWFYVDARRIESKEVSVGLRIAVPAEWEIEERSPASFQVLLQGPMEQMKTLPLTRLEILKRLDPQGQESDTYTETFTISDNELPLPPEVVVVSKSMETFSIRLVRLVPEYIRVAPKYEGKPAEGFRVLRIEAEPKSVKVMVPKGLVKYGDMLDCYPVDVNGEAGDVYRQASVKPTLIGERLLTSDEDIWVSVIIEPIPETRTIEGVPVRVLYGPPLDVRILKIVPPAVALDVEGPKAKVDPISERDSIVYVDLADLAEPPKGDVELRCRTRLPDKVTVKAIRPSTVRLTIR